MNRFSNSKLIESFLGERNRLKYLDEFDQDEDEDEGDDDDDEIEELTEKEMAQAVLAGRAMDEGFLEQYLHDLEETLSPEQFQQLVAGIDAEEVHDFARGLVNEDNDLVPVSPTVLAGYSPTVVMGKNNVDDSDEKEGNVVEGLKNTDSVFMDGLMEAWTTSGKTELFKEPMARSSRRYAVYEVKQDKYTLLKGEKNVQKMTGGNVKKFKTELKSVKLDNLRNQGDYEDAGNLRVVLVSGKKDNPALPQIIERANSGAVYHQTPSKSSRVYRHRNPSLTPDTVININSKGQNSQRPIHTGFVVKTLQAIGASPKDKEKSN
jgi:hypothetical protein